MSSAASAELTSTGASRTHSGERVPGTEARVAVDKNVVRALQLIVPPFNLGEVECPETLQVGGANPDRCTISIDSRKFDVVVRIDGASRAVSAQL